MLVGTAVPHHWRSASLRADVTQNVDKYLGLLSSSSDGDATILIPEQTGEKKGRINRRLVTHGARWAVVDALRTLGVSGQVLSYPRKMSIRNLISGAATHFSRSTVAGDTAIARGSQACPGIYNVHWPHAGSDYTFIRMNGRAYTRDIPGYQKWIREGHPEPRDPNSVLAEIYSPRVPPVMWALPGLAWTLVDFLVRKDFLVLLEDAGITGFTPCPVEIVKVATKGKRAPKMEPSGEPEDQIDRRRNVVREVELPELAGLRVTGTCEVVPVELPAFVDGRIRKYVFAAAPDTDLFHPMYDGKRYGGHVFCGGRFRSLVEDKRPENIELTPFDVWLKSIG
jgi:hypothetical protein